MAAEMTLELIKDIISTDLSNHDKLNAIEDIIRDDNQSLSTTAKRDEQ